LPKWLDRLLPNIDVEGEKLTDRPGAASEGSAGESHLVG
jgi:RND superfamily putative drug exporter